MSAPKAEERYQTASRGQDRTVAVTMCRGFVAPMPTRSDEVASTCRDYQ